MRPLLLALALVAAPIATLVVVSARTSASATPLGQAQETQEPKRPEAGDAAPQTRLNDQDGKAVKIGGDHSEDSSNWTVLAFFPKAATPG